MDPIHLGRVAEKLINTLDPDGDFEPNDPADRAELALGVRDARTGLTAIKGRLDDHAVAVFIAATDAHAKPRPETDGIKDQRSAAHPAGAGADHRAGRLPDRRHRTRPGRGTTRTSP